MKKPFHVFNFSIQNKGSKTIDVYIDGQVVDASTQEIIKAWFGDTTSVSYKSFREELGKENFDTCNVYINSPGGMVTDAMAIHDLLVDYQNKGKIINTIGRGLIASSATIILLAGKQPQMSANSMFMIHTVSGGCYGTVDEVESYAASMRKFNDMAVNLYNEKTGLSVEDLNKMMVKETWMTAKEAEEQKFIWKKIDNAAFTNVYNEAEWPFENTAILNTYNSFVDNKNFDMKKLFLDLKNDILAIFKDVKPAENHAALMTSIADALTKPFENLETGIETEVNTAVTNAVNTAVTNATAAFKQQIEDMEGEIVILKGKPTNGGKQEDAPKLIGQFNTKA